MGKTTNISWSERTANPWTGCTKQSPGCAHCYAEALMALRWKKVEWGAGKPRLRFDGFEKKVKKWNREAGQAGEVYPVFPSLCDPFDEEAPKEWRNEFYTICEETPHLHWLLLTKQPQNVLDFVPGHWIDPWGQWPSNVRVGVSVEDTKRAIERLPWLWLIPGENFVSMEPMLEAISPTLLFESGPITERVSELCKERYGAVNEAKVMNGLNVIDWIIFGGESNQGANKARPFDLKWVSSIMEYLSIFDEVPFTHFKQAGHAPVWNGTPIQLTSKGENMAHLADKCTRLDLDIDSGVFIQEVPSFVGGGVGSLFEVDHASSAN